MGDGARDYCWELNLDPKSLRRGLIIGAVDIVDCVWDPEEDAFAWLLENPEEFSTPIKPQKKPCGGAIFVPFD